MRRDKLSPIVRVCIEAAGRPLPIGKIATAIGAPRTRVSTACFNMTRTGVLTKSGKNNCTQYFGLGRDLKPTGFQAVSMTDNAARKRQARAEAAARRKADDRTRLAEAKRKAASQLRREQAKARIVQASLAAAARNAERRSAKEQPTVAKREQKRNCPQMTSEDFVRLGGTIERIPAAWDVPDA